jgi:hypothetical protein
MSRSRLPTATVVCEAFMTEFPFLMRIHRLLGVHRSECLGLGAEAFFERRLTIAARPMSDSELAQTMREVRARQLSDRARAEARQAVMMPPR